MYVALIFKYEPETLQKHETRTFKHREESSTKGLWLELEICRKTQPADGCTFYTVDAL